MRQWFIEKCSIAHDWGKISENPIKSSTISPCGSYILTGDDKGVIIQWDLEYKRSYRNWGHIHNGSILTLAITKDSRHLFSTESGCMKLSDISTGRCAKDFGTAHESGWIFSSAVGPDGKYLFTADNTGRVKQWCCKNWILKKSWGKIHNGRIKSMVVTPNGLELFTTCTDGF